jgi:tryptophanyl-tRNA synthetase
MSVESLTKSIAKAVVISEQVIDPFKVLVLMQVEGAMDASGVRQAIDYTKLIEQFGTRRIDDEMLKRFQKVTGVEPHPFLKRGLFFSHRDLSSILDRFAAGKPFYLYTGRGYFHSYI